MDEEFSSRISISSQSPYRTSSTNMDDDDGRDFTRMARLTEAEMLEME